MHLLTLVVRCGFPKPLTVDPLTISLVDSLLQSVLLCVKLGCLPGSWLFLLFTEASKQRKPSHMDKMQSERASRVQAQQQKFLFSLHNAATIMLNIGVPWAVSATARHTTKTH